MKFKQTWIYPLLLSLVVFIVSALNYVPGTWLTGWDNIHPEFNFGANIHRAFFSAWQEYQGVGLLAGMGHGADLFRMIFLSIVALIVPDELNRYFYHFLMLFVGTLGMYSILKDFFLPHTVKGTHKIAAAGALFYLLNLATVQFFYTPYEAFSTFWGFFPWELYTVFRFLEHRTARNLLIMALVHFLASAQGLVQVFFLVYCIFLGVSLLAYYWSNRSLQTLKAGALIVGVVICMNSYWFLINAYFTVTDVAVTQNAHINQMNVDRIFQLNRARGNLFDLATLRQFNYDFVIEKPEGGSGFLMEPWINYYQQPAVLGVALLIFAIAAIGILTQKSRYQGALAAMTFLVAVAFLTDTPGFDVINNGIRSLPLVNQIFRNAFTKFVVPLVFVYSIGLSLGLYALVHSPKIRTKLALQKTIPVLAIVLVFFLSIPTFQGHFFSKVVRQDIPDEYFETFAYFKEQPANTRIMNMPQEGFWGWGLQKWGTVGSGFLWYGIEQPILDRAFDVWSDDLENYYWQTIYALRRKDVALFEQILEKYQITHIVFDRSYVPSDSYPRESLISQLEFLEKSKKITLEKRFQDVSIYKINLDSKSNNFVSFRKNVPVINNNETYSNTDNAFINFGPYFSNKDKSDSSVVLPFGSLYTNRFSDELPFTFSRNTSGIEVATTFTSAPGNYKLHFKPYSSIEPLQLYDVYVSSATGGVNVRLEEASPEITVNDAPIAQARNSISVSIPGVTDEGVVLAFSNNQYFPINDIPSSETKIGSVYLERKNTQRLNAYSLPATAPEQLDNDNFANGEACPNTTGDGEPYYNRFEENGKLILESRNASICTTYNDPVTIPTGTNLVSYSYTYRSILDEKPNYCLIRTSTGTCINEKSTKNGFSTQNKSVTDFIPVSSVDQSIDFTLILDSTKAERLNRIQLSDMRLQFHELLETVAIPLPPQSKDESVIALNNLSENSTIKVTVPVADSSYSYPEVISNGRFAISQNDTYSMFKGNSYVNYESKSIKMYSQNAFLNFWLNFPDTLVTNGYILNVQSQNYNGFSTYLRLGTYDKSLLYTYTQLPTSIIPTHSYYVLPPNLETDKGIRVLFDNASVNRNPSVNAIQNASLYPFPYAYLSSIYLEKGTVTQASVPESGFEVERIHTGLFAISDVPTTGGIIEFAQAYDNGWKAYQVPDSGNFWFRLLPFFGGTELKTHGTMNNWSNGWQLEKGKGGDVILVFMPQYVQYFGFVILLLSLGGMTLWVIKKPDQEFFSVHKNFTRLKVD